MSDNPETSCPVKVRREAVATLRFLGVCVLCTFLGWHLLSPWALHFYYVYDHGYGESAMANLIGGLYGLAIPLVVRLIAWWLRFTDYRTHRPQDR
jgi:hypothetical protein